MFRRLRIPLYFLVSFLMLSLFGCTKKAELVEENNRFYVYVDELKVNLIKEVPWKVGPYYKQEISRGVRIHLELPKMKKSDMEKLYLEKKIDAWIVRLKRRASTSSRTMGYFVAQFAFPKPEKPEKIRYAPSSSASMGVYYAASSLSTRLDHIPCPALDHRLKIGDIAIEESKSDRRKLFSVTSAEREKIRAKVHHIAYSPVTVNGGMVLAGEYIAEIAFYNTIEKEKSSSWVRLDNYARVGREQTKVIRGCKGYRIPERSEDDDNVIKKFKFKR